MPLLQTTDFLENNNFILPKKYACRELYKKSKPTNILWRNRYQLLEPTSENIEIVSENIQITDTLHLLGNENELNGNRNALASQNTGNKRLSVGTQKSKPAFCGLLSSLVPNHLVKLLTIKRSKRRFDIYW